MNRPDLIPPGSETFEASYWRSPAAVDEALPPLSPGLPAEAEFRALADNLPTLCWIANGDGYIVWYNRRWHEYCGTTPVQMEGWGWQSVHDPAFLPQVVERWSASIATGEPFEMTFPLRGADGRFRPFLTRVSPLRDASGRVVRWYGVNTEIGQQLAAEAEARRSATLLEAIGQSAPSLIYAKDLDYRLIYANPATAAVFGKTVDDLIGRTAAELASATEEGEAHLDNDRRVIESGHVEDMHELLTTPDGITRTYRSTKAPLRDASGQIIGMVGVSLDITEQHRIEQALGASEARLRLAMGAGRMAVWDYDPASESIESSPELAELLGYPRDAQLDLQELRTRYYPGERERLAAAGLAALERGERFFQEEYRFYRADGELRWFLMRAELDVDENGQVRRAIGVVLDITEQKHTAEALADRQAELNAALDAGDLAVVDYDHRTGKFRQARRLNELYGYPADRELTIEDVRARYHPEAAPEIFAKRDRDALAVDESRFDWTLRILLPDGESRWLQGLGEYIRDAGGAIVRSRGVVMDVTERKRGEDHQRLLINELNHRVKNTLAIVQGLAQQSFKGMAADPEARQAFEGRLAALAAAHDLLTQENWESASLRQVVGDVIAPHGGDERFDLHGPELRVSPRTAVSLALGLHELSTNAAKYGALSSAAGRVQVSWTVGDGRLRLVWRERGGPRVGAPSKRGFGTRMIEKGLASDLGGSVTIDFDPNGVVCTIDAELPDPAAS